MRSVTNPVFVAAATTLCWCCGKCQVVKDLRALPQIYIEKARQIVECDSRLLQELQPRDIRTSCASEQGESGSYAGKIKKSFHVVVDNGYAFRSVQQTRAFVKFAFGEDSRVYRIPYGKNQESCMKATSRSPNFWLCTTSCLEFIRRALSTTIISPPHINRLPGVTRTTY